MSLHRRDSGLSLIELVVAMALFALVAVMGAQSLNGMLRLRDGLDQRAQRADALAQTLSLLRADLKAAVPLLFYPPDKAPPQSAARQTPTGFALSLGAQPAGPNRPGQVQFHRVLWQIDRAQQQLTRQVWRSLYPATQAAQTPPMQMIEGVEALRLRSHWGERGWQEGLNSPVLTPISAPETDGDRGSGAPEVFSSLLPDAIEITLVLRDLGEITLLEVLR